MKSRDKAMLGVELIKEAVLHVVKENPEGLGNSQIAQMLNIESDFEGKADRITSPGRSLAFW